jgi:SnoaL-like protein
MTDANELVARYLASWNETDPSRRRAAITEVWTEDGSYVDPLASVAGLDAIDATIAAAQGMFPGHTFRLAGPVDAHHNIARFTWELTPGDAPEATVVGFDVAVISEDGRFRAVHGSTRSPRPPERDRTMAGNHRRKARDPENGSRAGPCQAWPGCRSPRIARRSLTSACA